MTDKNIIFILGLPRSGTTILYNTLCKHNDLAYLEKTTSNNFMNPEKWKFPIYYKFIKPYPQEGGIWRRFHHELEYLETPTSEEFEYYKKAIDATCKMFGTNNFLSKNPPHVLRIKWLYAMFPKAKSIILHRDTDAYISSLWNYAKKNWDRDYNHLHKYEHGFEGWLTVNEKFGGNRESLSKDVVIKYFQYMKQKQIEDSQNVIPQDQRIDVDYEDFAENPRKTVNTLFEFMGLKKQNIPLDDIQNLNNRHNTSKSYEIDGNIVRTRKKHSLRAVLRKIRN